MVCSAFAMLRQCEAGAIDDNPAERNDRRFDVIGGSVTFVERNIGIPVVDDRVPRAAVHRHW